MGSILLWDLSTDASALDALRAVRVGAPWCSLIITLPSGNPVADLEGLYDTLSMLPGVPVTLKPGMNPVSAIRNRRPPSTAEVLRYVELRPGHEGLASRLRLLDAKPHADLSARGMRNHLSHASHCGVRHWKWVIHLAQLKLLPDESAEALAARYDFEVRALRRHVRSCLDVSLDEFRQLVGWEWRVEAALRLHSRGGGGAGGGISKS